MGEAKGLVEKATLRGGINSRPYGRQLLIIHRAGHLALPKEVFQRSLKLHPYIKLCGGASESITSTFACFP